MSIFPQTIWEQYNNFHRHKNKGNKRNTANSRVDFGFNLLIWKMVLLNFEFKLNFQLILLNFELNLQLNFINLLNLQLNLSLNLERWNSLIENWICGFLYWLWWIFDPNYIHLCSWWFMIWTVIAAAEIVPS